MSVTQHLAEKYKRYLDRRAAETVKPLRIVTPSTDKRNAYLKAHPELLEIKVGIVGGGMAGLYSALLLNQHQNVSVKIFEATDRVGGRVYTHRFSEDQYQYFEAGAMRLPEVTWQKPVFDLIAYLNERVPPDFKIDLIPYHYSWSSGNRVYVNGTKQKDGQIMSVDYANEHLDELAFPPEADATTEAGKLLQDAINPVVKELKEDFEAALKKYDSMTLHYYLSQTLGWSEAKINYVEVMSSQTNEFRNGLVDQAILNSDFTGQVPQWKTIDNGMCRLPEAAAKMIGEKNIMLQTTVESLTYLEDGRVKVGYVESDQNGKMKNEIFDAVILALPPSAVRMIPGKPQWPVPLEHGLRSIHFQPLYKIGLRFNSRFWERQELRPSKGGQSITDLPCRWVVYPSYGLGDTGKGVLLLYSWMTDSDHWLPKSKEQKIKYALRNLKELYPEVDIDKEYAGSISEEAFLKEAFPVEWAVKWPLGDATFYAGQFSSLYPIMTQPQDNIYFAGEHLSVYHTWIVGALDSARTAVQQLLCKLIDSNLKVEYLKP